MTFRVSVTKPGLEQLFGNLTFRIQRSGTAGEQREEAVTWYGSASLMSRRSPGGGRLHCREAAEGLELIRGEEEPRELTVSWFPMPFSSPVI